MEAAFSSEMMVSHHIITEFDSREEHDLNLLFLPIITSPTNIPSLNSLTNYYSFP
jgi:hypothetical protein